MTVSAVYVTDKSKRSPSYCFNVRRGDVVEVVRSSTREEADAKRKAAEKLLDFC